jgi:hypothetical protein
MKREKKKMNENLMYDKKSDGAILLGARVAVYLPME